MTDMESKYQQICESMKEIEAVKLLVDEKLAQSEAAKLVVDEKLVQVEEKNQELRRVLEAQERTLSVNRSVFDSY